MTNDVQIKMWLLASLLFLIALLFFMLLYFMFLVVPEIKRMREFYRENYQELLKNQQKGIYF